MSRFALVILFVWFLLGWSLHHHANASVYRSAPSLFSTQNAIQVNSTADVIANNGQCTLREAITAANTDTSSGTMAGECIAGDGDDTIEVPAGIYTLTITGTDEDANQMGDLDLVSDIVIQGADRATTIINGNGIDRVFHQFNGTVAIQHLTITNGEAPHGNTPGANGAGGGGILLADGTLTLIESDVRGNQAGNGATGTATVGGAPAHGGYGGKGGGILQAGGTLILNEVNVVQNRAGTGGNGGTGGSSKLRGGNGGDGGAGGGIYTEVSRSLTLNTSTIDDNAAGNGGASSGMPGVWMSGAGGQGGGIFVDGNTTIVESTVSRNRAGVVGSGSVPGLYGNGGGAYLRNGTLINSTISQNEAQEGNGGGIYSTENLTLTAVTIAFNEVPFEGGGLYAAGTTHAANTLMNGNLASYGPDCYGTLQSQGYILIGAFDPDFPVCELTGISTGNQIGVDARLAPLMDNGGSTETHALSPDSPGLDAGHCFGLTNDQRGFPRPSDLPTLPNVADGCDIGAYEEQAPPPLPTATSTIKVTFTPTPTATPTVTVTVTPTPAIPSSGQTLYLPLIRRATP